MTSTSAAYASSSVEHGATVPGLPAAALSKSAGISAIMVPFTLANNLDWPRRLKPNAR